MDETGYIDPAGRDGIEVEDDKWDDGKITEIKARLDELRHFNEKLETSSHENFGNITLGKRMK